MAEPVLISYARGLLQRVPRRARGDGRRDPGRHRRRRDHRRRRARPGAGAADHPGRVGWRQPAASTRRSSTTSATGSPQHPLYDSRGPADRRPRVAASPARGRVQAQLTRAKAVIDRRREAAAGAAAARQAGRRWRPSSRPSGSRSSGRCEYVQLYGLYTECEAIYQVDNLLAMWDGLDAADQATFAFDPRAVDWPTYIRDDPPAVDRPARPRSRRRRARRPHRPHRPPAPPACSTRPATSPRSTSRTR